MIEYFISVILEFSALFIGSLIFFWISGKIIRREAEKIVHEVFRSDEIRKPLEELFRSMAQLMVYKSYLESLRKIKLDREMEKRFVE